MLAELNKYGFQCSASSQVRTELKHSVVNKAVDQWRPRLRTCVRAKGQHFEQLLNWIVAFSCWILDLQMSVFSDRNFFTRLGVYVIVFVRRLSNKAC